MRFFRSEHARRSCASLSDKISFLVSFVWAGGGTGASSVTQACRSGLPGSRQRRDTCGGSRCHSRRGHGPEGMDWPTPDVRFELPCVSCYDALACSHITIVIDACVHGASSRRQFGSSSHARLLPNVCERNFVAHPSLRCHWRLRWFTQTR